MPFVDFVSLVDTVCLKLLHYRIYHFCKVAMANSAVLTEVYGAAAYIKLLLKSNFFAVLFTLGLLYNEDLLYF